MPPLTLLLFSRFFTGFMEGNIGILRAAVVDRSAADKHRAFGMIGTGVTLGYAIGPLLGACLSNSKLVYWFNVTTPFYAGAFTTFIAAIIAWLFLHEPIKHQLGPQNQPKPLMQHFNIFRQLHTLCRNRSLMLMFISSFCFWFAVDIYYEFFPAYLVEIWGMDALAIALLTVALSFGLVLGNGLSRFIAQYYADIPVIFWHIILYALMLGATLLVSHLFILYVAFSLTGIFIAISSNHLTVQVSEHASADQQGEALGMATGIRMLGDSIISFAGGFLMLISTRLPLACAVVCALIAAFIVLTTLYRPFLKERRFSI